MRTRKYVPARLCDHPRAPRCDNRPLAAERTNLGMLRARCPFGPRRTPPPRFPIRICACSRCYSISLPISPGQLPRKLAVHDLTADTRYTYAQLDDAIDRGASVLRGALRRAAGQACGGAVTQFGADAGASLCVYPHRRDLRTAQLAPRAGRNHLHARGLRALADRARTHVRGSARAANDSAHLIRRQQGRIRRAHDRGSAADLAGSWCVAVDGDAPITLLYSSGTTGKPKGVIVTQLNAFSGALNLALGTACSPQATFLCDMPMFHTAGLFAAARAAARGRNGAHQSEVRCAGHLLAPRRSQARHHALLLRHADGDDDAAAAGLRRPQASRISPR